MILVREEETDTWKRRGSWYSVREKRKLILGSKVVFLKRFYFQFCGFLCIAAPDRQVEKRWEEKLWWSWLQGVLCFQFCWILAADILVAHWQESDKTPTATTNPVNPWNSKIAELPSVWYQTTSLFLHACNLTLLPMSEKPFTEITYKQTIRYGGQQQLTRAFFFPQT